MLLILVDDKNTVYTKLKRVIIIVARMRKVELYNFFVPIPQ